MEELISRLVATSYVPWSLTALLVSLCAFAVAWGHRHDRVGALGPVAGFALGMGIAQFGEGGTRTWWLVWRFLKDRDVDVAWMVGNFAVLVFSVLVIVGLHVYLRAFTRTRFGEKAWLSWAALNGWLSALYFIYAT